MSNHTKALSCTAGLVALSTGIAMTWSAPSHAIAIFQDRDFFLEELTELIVDDYEALEYRTGDVQNLSFQDIHSDASMGAIVGETQYTSTGFSNTNLILLDSDSGNHQYCAGCNASFELGFANTSLSQGGGVLGVGFDIPAISVFLATVSFADGTQQDFDLNRGFWGITSETPISAIHVGAENGGIIANDPVANIEIDNLTIGTFETASGEPEDVPEASTLLGLFLLGGLAGYSRRSHIPVSGE